jgi:Zn-dependent metalloprotease
MSSRSCHLCQIIPSSVLRKLALHPQTGPKERDALLISAEAAAFARGERTVGRFLAMAAPEAVTAGKHRDIFDARGKARISGQLVRTEGGPPAADEAANQAYDSTGTTYDFYSEVFQRNSVNGRGLKLESTVHSGKAPDNAFWNGARMVFGDATPNGPFVGSFAALIDVVAHELTHGVTQYTVPGGGLEYVDQSGALNESWSDVFGSVVKQWKNKQDVKSADWLIGAGILNPKYGKALRSMKDPGTAWSQDDQPADMKHYVEGGDVHTNSGIPNRAFYLAADGIGGNSWDKSGRIWYKGLSLLTAQATFKDAAQATIEAAATLYGASGAEAKAVKQAWTTVQVL